MTQPETQPRDSGSLGLTQKMGPLPVWGWIALAAAGGIGVLVWLQHRKSAAADTTGTNSTVAVQGADAATVANLQDQLGVVLSQIRDLQGGPSTPTGPTTVPLNSNQVQTSQVKAGWSVYQYLSDLNDQFQQQGNTLRVTYSQLLALNPGLANNINNADPAKPTFKQDMMLNIHQPTVSAQGG